MKKFLIFFTCMFAMILLEFFYLNLQLNRKINRIENKQQINHLSIESINKMSDQSLDGLNRTFSTKNNFAKTTGNTKVIPASIKE